MTEIADTLTTLKVAIEDRQREIHGQQVAIEEQQREIQQLKEKSTKIAKIYEFL